MSKRTGSATWTCHQEASGNLWYIALSERVKSPYKRQIRVQATIDLDVDLRVVGIEIVDPQMPEPPRHPLAADQISGGK